MTETKQSVGLVGQMRKQKTSGSAGAKVSAAVHAWL